MDQGFLHALMEDSNHLSSLLFYQTYWQTYPGTNVSAYNMLQDTDILYRVNYQRMLHTHKMAMRGSSMEMDIG